MALRKRRKEIRPGRNTVVSSRPGQGTEEVRDNNAIRRELYRRNPIYRNKVIKRAREYYVPMNDPTRKTPSSATVEPDYKEVVVQGTEECVYAYVYTVPRLAEALGRSIPTVKKWISEGLIPPPIIRDTSRNYAHYSVGEYEIIRTFLKERERTVGLQYLGASHAVDIERLHQQLEGFRKSNI